MFLRSTRLAVIRRITKVSQRILHFGAAAGIYAWSILRTGARVQLGPVLAGRAAAERARAVLGTVDGAFAGDGIVVAVAVLDADGPVIVTTEGLPREAPKYAGKGQWLRVLLTPQRLQSLNVQGSAPAHLAGQIRKGIKSGNFGFST